MSAITASASDRNPSHRNQCLDFLKGIAALGVIFVHIPFPGKFGKCINAVGSCGVMLFFLISGFHAYGSREEMRPKLLRRFRRNLCITLIAFPVYFAVSAYEYDREYHVLRSWLRQFASPKLYLRMFLFNDLDVIHAAPLWFMLALLYAYLIFILMYQLRLQKYAKFAMPLFLLLRIGLETYKYAIDGDWRICSNVFVAAMPLMLLGYCIAEQKEKLLRIPAWGTAVCTVVSVICLFLLIVFDPFRYNITQIFKLTAVASAFLFAEKKSALRLFPPLCRLGGACSLHVYLWHMPVIVLLYLFCEKRHFSGRFYDWYLPLIVAAVSVLLAVVIVTILRAGRKILKLKHS